MEEFVVYVLHSLPSDKIYVGMTSDLLNRMKSHNEFGTKGFTIKYRPWRVVYIEFFELKGAALKREKQLKSYQGRLFIRNLLKTV